MGGDKIMITSFSLGVLLAGGVILIVLCFVEYVLWQDSSECTHQNKTTYDSYHKQVCIDCGKEFLTSEIKK